ncbi:hypothetical protein F5146DRAFT_1067698 [Armillaria mellea]|nr:hypothetical protein F5146DRAFT_1067698 [Armillaria mellea]
MARRARNYVGVLLELSTVVLVLFVCTVDFPMYVGMRIARNIEWIRAAPHKIKTPCLCIVPAYFTIHNLVSSLKFHTSTCSAWIAVISIPLAAESSWRERQARSRLWSFCPDRTCTHPW